MAQIQAFDFSVDLLRALLWQYNKAERLEGLLRQKQAWYDANQSEFWDDWVRDVFDLRTANDFGLAVWSIILDLPLTIAGTPDPAGKPVFGFATYHKNFTRGNFTGRTGSPLSTSQKRILLQLRYFQLVTRGTVPEVNAFLGKVFADLGTVYVLDDLDMTIRYIFPPMPAALRNVIEQFDLLPRPAGVKVTLTVLRAPGGFGFGVYHKNFTRGNFYHA